MDRKKQVFLCYAKEDTEKVRDLYNKLTSHGFPTWFDEESLLPGMTWKKAIEQAIPNSAVVIICLSEKAINKRGFVQNEIQMALDAARNHPDDTVFIIPVRLGECDLPSSLSHIHSVFIYEDHGFNQLIKALNTFAGSDEADTRFNPKNKNTVAEIDAIKTILSSLPKDKVDTIKALLIDPFLEAISSSRAGNIPLSPSDYYSSISTDIGNAGRNWEITAISTMPSILWETDINQNKYAKLNQNAIDRGAKIRRLFVVSDEIKAEFLPIIFEQKKSGISVKVSSPDKVVSLEHLKDAVIFKGPGIQKTYIGIPAIDNDTNRINSGALILDSLKSDMILDAFDNAWSNADDVDQFVAKAKFIENKQNEAPGNYLKRFYLDDPVISCSQAAEARNVPLSNELKTLILETSSGTIAAHMRGDEKLNLRKVKRFLESVEAYLIDPETLSEMGLSAGTVSAVLEPIWSLPHLFSITLFELEYVTTNDGTKTGYFKFDPSILTKAKTYRIGDITV